MLPGDMSGFDDDDELLNLTNFKPMAEDANWYLQESGSNSQTPNPCDPLQLHNHPLDQSSCSQSPAFRLLAGATPDPLFGFTCESSSFDVDAYPLEDFVANPELGPPPKLSQIPEEVMGFDPFEVPPLPKALRPLESEPPEGAQPTLFQKRRAAMRKEVGESDMREDEERSGDGSVGNYETMEEEEGKGKGKGKGLPAKNLMAERRRRKKLNDRLYMLRSVVPKISKMDRASILGDAVDYLKELLQRINDLNEELKSAQPSASMVPSTSNDMFFHTLAPTLPPHPSRIKEELSSIPMACPGSQPARIEVRLSEGREVNIHMFCARSPGLLLSTMRTLDNLGLDIQQAVISCFNGFSLDVFRAEQCKDGPAVQPEEIKTMLLHSAGLQGAMP